MQPPALQGVGEHPGGTGYTCTPVSGSMQHPAPCSSSSRGAEAKPCRATELFLCSFPCREVTRGRHVAWGQPPWGAGVSTQAPAAGGLWQRPPAYASRGLTGQGNGAPLAASRLQRWRWPWAVRAWPEGSGLQAGLMRAARCLRVPRAGPYPVLGHEVAPRSPLPCLAVPNPWDAGTGAGVLCHGGLRPATAGGGLEAGAMPALARS